MKQGNFFPSDFTKNFSPLNKAELYTQIVDERPLLDRFFWGKILNKLFGKFLQKYKVLSFDKRIEKVWKETFLKFGDTSSDSLVKYLEDKFSDDHLRKFEYSFLVKCLARKDVSCETILDIGGGWGFSTMVPILLDPKKVSVVCLDVVNYPSTSKFGVKYVKGSCIETNLPDSSFDMVTIISTLEHIGLGRYGDPQDPQGDIKTMKEVKRILKKSGHVVLTIPYGYPTVVYNLHRVYDKGWLNIITEGFEKVLVEYSLFGKKAPRQQVEDRKVTKDIPGFYQDIPFLKRIYNPPGGVMALLKKK